jgi:hypothetical protein
MLLKETGMESTSGNNNLSARVRRTLEDLAAIRKSLLPALNKPCLRVWKT